MENSAESITGPADSETPGTDTVGTETNCPTSSDNSLTTKEKKVDSDDVKDDHGRPSPRTNQDLKRQVSVEGAQGQNSKRDDKLKKSRNEVDIGGILKTLINEVNTAPQIIARGGIVSKQEDAKIICCDDLETNNPLKDLEDELRPDHSWAGDFLEEIVLAMFGTLRDTKQMEEIYRRYQHHKLECGKDGKLYGVEILFIVKGLQNPSAASHHSSVLRDGTSNPIMVIAYRVLVKTLEGNPEDVPKNSELESLDI